MDDHNRKFTAALAELDKAGITGARAWPLDARLMRRLGLKRRPPLYQPFWWSVISFGLSFAISWGLVMWVGLWRQNGQSITTSINLAALAGLLFGLGMAVFNQYSRKRHSLSRWDDL